MHNEVESIEVLAEALQKSCGLFNQLVKAHTDLLKLESQDQPTKPCIRRVDGKRQILTADEAVAFDEAKSNEQTFVLHRIQDDFLAAFEDTGRAIKQHALADALEPFVDKPGQWIAELHSENEGMRYAALYPYYPSKNGSILEPGAMTPEDRMADLFAVQRRLGHLNSILGTRSQTTLAAPEQSDKAPDVLQLPSKEAMMAWRLRALKGQTQQGIADEMTRQLNRKVKQPAVSNWLKEADEFLLAGGIFPKLLTMPQAPVSVDPTVIEMGERVDGLSKHQRKQRDDAE